MGKTFIITGICGHFGNSLARELQARGHEVRGLALPGEDASMLDARVALTRGDVRDPASMRPLFDGVSAKETVFIHAAGIISISARNPRRIYDVNVGGTANVIAQCRERGISRLVYISSVHALPEKPVDGRIAEIAHFSPNDVEGDYSRSKAMATQLVLDAVKDGLDAVVVHPSGMIGPNDYCGGYMTETIADYMDGTLYAGIAGGYDFVDVRDVAEGVIAAAEKGRAGECYILSGKYCSVRDLANILREFAGRPAIRLVFPVWFIKIFLPLVWSYFRLKDGKALVTGDSLRILNAPSGFTHEKATRELGYQPRDLRTTLADTVAFIRKTRRIGMARASRAR